MHTPPHHQLLAALTFLLAFGCSDGDPHDEPDPGQSTQCLSIGGGLRPLILNGDLDSQDPAVASVNLLQTECLRAGSPICTGTLMGSGLVITAAHCADPPAPSLFGVVFGALGNPGEGPLGEGLDGQFFRVTRLRIHPDFDLATLANDVAIMVLDGTPSLPAIDLYPSTPSQELVGRQVKLVGFGLSDADDSEESAKRSGTATIQNVGDQVITYVAGPAMTCEGDSGGPVIITEAGREYLLGVTSRGDGTCNEYGKAVRVDRLPAELLATVVQ